MSEWRDIASAPKDGTMVLLHPSRCWTDDVEPCDCEVGYWDHDSETWESASGTAADDYTGPTHWHPLPLPPPPADRIDPSSAPHAQD